MPAPTSYRTEADFAAYLHSINPVLFESFGWSVEEDSYAEVIADTLEQLGVSTITGVSKTRDLRIVGKYFLWQAAYDFVTGTHHSYSGTGGSVSLGQVYDQVKERFNLAYMEAMPYGVGNYKVTAARVSRRDIYSAHTEEN